VLHITPGERRALELLANGGPMREIAVSLGVHVGEVGADLRSLFFRMGVTDETEAVAAAWRRGLLKSGNESIAGHFRPHHGDCRREHEDDEALAT
jgi:DNA-binding CsgD family transcriptional regulator